MATANPLWRAPRIHGELKMLGIAISERTVSRILRRLPRPPHQTWTDLLAQPCRPNRIDRFLYRTDNHNENTGRIHRPRARSSEGIAF
jgi:hypothetical protein